MRYTIGTRNSPCTLEIKLRARKPMILRIQAYDVGYENTFLTNRLATMAREVEEIYWIQMPLSPNVCGIAVFEDGGRGPDIPDDNFEVIYIKKKGLPRQLDVSGISDSRVRSFVRFGQRFCYNAGWLSTNSDGECYTSDDGLYKIKYVPIISDLGKEVITPARINKFTAITEVSQRKFIDLTVPERFCIDCHEKAHLFLNKDETNELEADLNGLTIYLALGFPRIEALEVFIKTFYAVPTPQNLERFKHIEEFITNFDDYFYADKKMLA